MIDSKITAQIERNLQQLKLQIEQACVRSRRMPSSVQIVAVTKYAEWSWVEALSQLHGVFGENRPQQLAEREALLPNIEWHLIGQLQRNKVKLALQHASVIHSVDSLRLLKRIAEVGRELDILPRVLLQVNVTGEASKSGFTPEELRSAWAQLLQLARLIRIDGLMTMARPSEDPEDARPAFSALRRLRDELAGRSESQDATVRLPDLSMGMSHDFAQAVEEGATLIRVGSRLFEGLNEPSL